MAKINRPEQLSHHFGIEAARFDALGVLDPTLNVDTPLFIDPLLLRQSAHAVISADAPQRYEQYFGEIIALLRASRRRDDAAWRSAKRRLRFPEVRGTCLGYGASSVAGSGIGRLHQDQLIETAAEIVELGIEDPNLFVVLALFESGIGPDRIGDMTTNVILPDLVRFAATMAAELELPTERFRFGEEEALLPRNPYEARPTPVILVPNDILRHLPLASDWYEAMDAASQNDQLRDRVNRQIGEIWQVRTRRDKEELKDRALSSREAFRTVLELLEGAPRSPYDQSSDSAGEIFWRRLSAKIQEEHPFEIQLAKPLDVEEACRIVDLIIERFKFLIEDRRLATELYDASGKPRPERSAQKLFFVVADAYCAANNLDITPEAETGAGPVDFKFSIGHDCRIVVEVKLSKNSKLVAGFTKQTRAYAENEEAVKAYYLVIDVGGMGEKDEHLMREKNDLADNGQELPEIIFVDGAVRPSASKR